jgi:hypothetical protein
VREPSEALLYDHQKGADRMKIERRGFIGTLLALPVLRLAVPAAARAEPVMAPVLEFAPQAHVFDAALGDMLGFETRDVSDAQYRFRGADGRIDFNCCQIFRTPVRWLGPRWAGRATPEELMHEARWRGLDEHLDTIREVLIYGRRALIKTPQMAITTTGGRRWFGVEKGMLAVYRGRGLAFKRIAETRGEWLSDVGFLPGELV